MGSSGKFDRVAWPEQTVTNLAEGGDGFAGNESRLPGLTHGSRTLGARLAAPNRQGRIGEPPPSACATVVLPGDCPGNDVRGALIF